MVGRLSSARQATASSHGESGERASGQTRPAVHRHIVLGQQADAEAEAHGLQLVLGGRRLGADLGLTAVAGIVAEPEVAHRTGLGGQCDERFVQQVGEVDGLVLGQRMVLRQQHPARLGAQHLPAVPVRIG